MGVTKRGGASSATKQLKLAPQPNGKVSEKIKVKKKTISSFTIFLVLFLMYFTPPLVVRYNKWVRDTFVFVHHVKSPFDNISDPHSFGIQAVRQLELFHEDGCGIEIWQMLPKQYYLEGSDPADQQYSNSNFIRALSDGSPVVLYLHGNTGTRATRHRIKLYKYLSGTLGYHVITFDYRGFGNSQCYPSEDGMMEDALLVWKWLGENAKGVKVYIWGHSLGSAAATYLTHNLCHTQDIPSGLILEAPFTNIIEAGQNHPIALPYRPIMSLFSYFVLETFEYTFSSEDRISKITCPILILHGRKDGVVPFHLGQKLYRKAVESRKTNRNGETVEFLDCEEGGHKTSWESPKAKEVLKRFIKP